MLNLRLTAKERRRKRARWRDHGLSIVLAAMRSAMHLSGDAIMPRLTPLVNVMRRFGSRGILWQLKTDR